MTLSQCNFCQITYMAGRPAANPLHAIDNAAIAIQHTKTRPTLYACRGACIYVVHLAAAIINIL